MIFTDRETRELIKECITMLETYRDEMCNLGGNTDTLVQLKEPHKKVWMEKYYPQLVQTGIIVDDRYFYPDGSVPNWGIGNDSTMNKSDYCQLLYQLYKAKTVGGYPTTAEEVLVVKCIRMLEPYHYYFVNKQNSGAAKRLSKNHMTQWENIYYPELVYKGIICDNLFFDHSGTHKHMGIGTDGCFTGAELHHFLYEAYKKMGESVTCNLFYEIDPKLIQQIPSQMDANIGDSLAAKFFGKTLN